MDEIHSLSKESMELYDSLNEAEDEKIKKYFDTRFHSACDELYSAIALFEKIGLLTEEEALKAELDK